MTFLSDNNTENQGTSGLLAAITSYYNPAGFSRTREKYKQFAGALERQGVELFTIEVTLPDQEPELEGPRVWHLQSASILWHREAAFNAAIKRMPKKYSYVAFIDCDLLFQSDDWYKRAIDALAKYPIVQLFEKIIDLDSADNPMRERLSSAAVHARGKSISEEYSAPAPGGAWVAHRDLLERHTIFDLALVGGGDMLFANACFGLLDLEQSPFAHFSPGILTYYFPWARRMYEEVAGNVGFVSETIHHLWHGSRRNRKYAERHRILKNVDPSHDLRRNSDGLWEWSTTADPEKREAVKQYFVERREDGPNKKAIANTKQLPQFTKDWISCKTPMLLRHLSSFCSKSDLHFLEIGSFEGRSAWWFLRKILTGQNCTITCVDTFEGGKSPVFHSDPEIVVGLEERFDNNIKLAGEQKRVVKHVGASADILRTLPKNAYDCIYIDGSHLAQDVLADAVLAWDLLKRGGILVFDDYTWENFLEDRDNPRTAIDAFLRIYHAELLELEHDVCVVVQKKKAAADFPAFRNGSMNKSSAPV